MNIKFDYYKFPKDKSIQYTIPIDTSGVQLDQSPAVIEQDSDGTTSIIETSEVKNNYVNFVYSSLPNKADLYTYTPIDDGVPVQNTDESPPTNLIEYRMLDESVEEADIVNTLQEDEPKNMALSNNTSLNNAIVGIIPAHLLMVNNNPHYDSYTLSATAPLCNREVLAAFNLISTNKYNIHNKATKKIRGSLSKIHFKKTLQKITDATKDNGVDVLVKEYGITDGVAIKLDPNYNYGLERYTKLNAVSSSASTFISKHMTNGDMTYYKGSDVTPFMMSVKDAFKAYFTPPEELYDLFVDTLIDIFDTISSNHILGNLIHLNHESLGLTNDFVLYSQNAVLNDKTLPKIPVYKNPTGFFASFKHRTFDRYDNNTVDNINPTVPLYESIGNGQFKKKLIDIDTESNPNVTYYTVRNKPLAVKDASYMYEREWDFNENSVHNIVKSINNIKSEIRRAIHEMLLLPIVGEFKLLMIYDTQDTVNSLIRTLNSVIKQIKWYQTYTNESIFPTKVFITDDSFYGKGRINPSNFTYNKQLARILVPVYYGKIRQKARKKKWGMHYTVIRKLDLGVRFIELMFVNNNIFKEYRKRNVDNGLVIPTSLTFNSLRSTNGQAVGTLLKSLPNSVMSNIYINKTPVSFTITNASIGQFNGTFLNGIILDNSTIKFTLALSTTGIANGALLSQVIIPRPPSKGNDKKDITINYQMPYLPYDSEIKRFAYNQYGAFDQSKQSTVNGTIPGWEIFHNSSKEIEAMRSGIDVYRKVEFLMKILESEFGKSRVHLIETTRSSADQNILQMGGDSSVFLSWHNYGLAAKIKITTSDMLTPIKEGSNDFFKLIDIADAFIIGALRGDYGTPLNVVWCAQLVTGPDIFVWEFLPIGVHHKDVIKFRDNALQQEDPVVSNGYVNATNMIVKTIPTNKNTKYVLATSKAVTDGINIGKTTWVDPKKIVNNILPKGLVLKDIHEFLTLIDTKIKANGSILFGRKKIREWKQNNPISFNQLVMYYSLIGSFASVRGLISGDYIDTFNTTVRTLAPINPVTFLKEYLGDFYYKIQIKSTEFGDSAYINLSNGLITSQTLMAKSTQPESTDNLYGEQQIDRNSVAYGQYVDGKWIPEGSSGIISFTSTDPVIDGYNEDGTIIGSAYELHVVVVTDVINEFKSTINNFENLKIQFMHDKFSNSPNAGDTDTLENEFGVISTQDIIPLKSLRDLYTINKINTKTDPDGTLRGVGSTAETVYEKLVSTAQINGARKSVLTKEKPVIEALETKIDLEKIYTQLKSDTQNRMPSIKDLL